MKKVMPDHSGQDKSENGTKEISESQEYFAAALSAAVCAEALLGYRGFVRVQESVAAADIVGRNVGGGEDWRR